MLNFVNHRTRHSDWWYLIAYNLLSVVLFSLFAYTIYNSTSIRERNNDFVVHTNNVMEQMRTVQIKILERSLLLSYSKEYVSEEDQRKSVEAILLGIGLLVQDNSSQSDRIKQILEAYKNYSTYRARAFLFKSGSDVYAGDTQNLKRYIDSYRKLSELIEQFLTEEDRVLELRLSREERSRRNYNNIIVFGAMLSVIMLIVLNLAVYLAMVGQKQRISGLLDKETFLKMFLNHMKDGVYDLNVDTREVSYSKSYFEQLGYHLDVLPTTVEEGFDRYIHPDDLPAKWERIKAFANGQIPDYTTTFRMKHRDGTWRWILSRAFLYVDPSTKTRRLIGMHTDITDQKRQENYIQEINDDLMEALEKTQVAQQAKDAFLAMVSHEIRTPLNVIIGTAQLLEQKGINQKDAERLISILHVNSRQLLNVVNDTLDLSKIEADAMVLQSTHFSVDSMLTEIKLMFEEAIRKKSLRFIIDQRNTNDVWIGDPLRIKQILINLLSNAIKFTQSGHVKVTVSEDDKGLIWRVEDTGIGIPQDKIDSIFESFVQVDPSKAREYTGTGLGLSIAKSLVHLMGGTITVSSSVNQGACFTINVPLQRDDQDVADEVEKPQELSEKSDNRSILLVEDYDANALIAEMMLKNMGYSPKRVSSGAEAIKAVEQSNEPFYAILMDIQMPEMNGYDATKFIREIERKRKWSQIIVGVTAHALHNEEEKCLEAGMDGYSSKPVDWYALERKISSL